MSAPDVRPPSLPGALARLGAGDQPLPTPALPQGVTAASGQQSAFPIALARGWGAGVGRTSPG